MRDRTIDYALRVAWQAVVRFYNEEAAKVDMTMAMGFVLLSIDPVKGTPSTALGPKMGLEATSLSRILKVLESEGLIERRPHPVDGRSVLIGLTPLGVQKRDASKEVVLHFNEVVRSSVTERKLNHFYEVLETIVDLVQNKKVYLEELQTPLKINTTNK